MVATLAPRGLHPVRVEKRFLRRKRMIWLCTGLVRRIDPPGELVLSGSMPILAAIRPTVSDRTFETHLSTTRTIGLNEDSLTLWFPTAELAAIGIGHVEREAARARLKVQSRWVL